MFRGLPPDLTSHKHLLQNHLLAIMFIGRQLHCQHIGELDMAIALILPLPRENRVQKVVLSSRINAAGK